MLVLEAMKIKKYYGTKKIIDIKNLKVYKNDRIGIVGLNGAGKTTLMDILSLYKSPDEGLVNHYGESSYIQQLNNNNNYNVNLNNKISGEFKVNNMNSPNISGGEKTRTKIALSFKDDIDILFADEPTSNLDMEGINLLEEKLKSFNGAVILISHDRSLLDSICNKIIEVSDGQIKEYTGNYSDYKLQKKNEKEREKFEYNNYIKEKRKLENAIFDRSMRANNMKKTPSRMGISEARLHKRSTSARQAKLHQSTNALKTRIEKLEKKDKPKEFDKVNIDIPSIYDLHSKIVINGDNISKSFDEKILFENSSLQIHNGDKTAIVGNNGCGKTTLLNMILSGDGFFIAPKVKIAYFKQDLSILKDEETILESVMSESIHPETFVRTLLARLLFKKEEVYKKIKLLSGGERVKVALAKIFVKDINLIILDEPTNFLDLESIESLEEVLSDFKGTLLCVSHDRSFIDKIVNKVIVFEDQKLNVFEGNYTQYLKNKESNIDNTVENYKKELLIFENRLSEITSKLSIPSKDYDVNHLDKEFNETLKKIKSLKKLIND